MCASCPGMLIVPVGADKFDNPVREPWFCECGKDHRTPYCHACKNERIDEVDPESWSCLDGDVCAGRIEARRRNNELWQMLQRCKSVSALARKAKREQTALALVLRDPLADEDIEQRNPEVDLLLNGYTEAKPRKQKPKAAPRPTSGTCECGCTGKTKGGRFLPGHDAKLASALKSGVQNGDTVAYTEMKRRGWLGKLPAALRAEWEGK